PFLAAELPDPEVALLFGVAVALLLALADEEQRGLRDEDMTLLDQVTEVPEEEREHERADVRSVDVSVHQQDHFVVAELRRVVVRAHAATELGYDGLDLLVLERLQRVRLLDVQDLAAQWQDRLVRTVPAHLGATACRVTLDEEQLVPFRIIVRAVGQLAGQDASLELAMLLLASASAGRRHTCLRGQHNALDDPLHGPRVLVEERLELLADKRLDGRTHLAIRKSVLGLALV